MPAVFPYESQWGSVRATEEVVVNDGDPAPFHDWRASGFTSAEEYRFWARHVCGLACLRSVLQAWQGRDVPLAELLTGARASGALVHHPDDTVGGLFYRPFLDWVGAEYGLRGEVVENTRACDLLAPVGEETVAILSVSPEVRWPEHPNRRRGGHLVLVYSTADGVAEFHNPSGVTGCAAGARVHVDVLERFASGRGMLLHR
ncbi:hypothetical protein ACFVWR_05750 [Leifsonia sp. NPDC058292]|uniref:hypothetical protein n=1 Tax=Leifsonia sp. NPDC058292 TaxID=3346428 RepID=UPI0036DAFE32